MTDCLFAFSLGRFGVSFPLPTRSRPRRPRNTRVSEEGNLWKEVNTTLPSTLASKKDIWVENSSLSLKEGSKHSLPNSQSPLLILVFFSHTVLDDRLFPRIDRVLPFLSSTSHSFHSQYYHWRKPNLTPSKTLIENHTDENADSKHNANDNNIPFTRRSFPLDRNWFSHPLPVKSGQGYCR